MPAAYNPENGRFEMIPNGAGGWLRGYRPLDAAPPGTVRMVVMFKAWMDEFPSNTQATQSDIPHNAGCYLGLSFGIDTFEGGYAWDPASSMVGFVGHTGGGEFGISDDNYLSSTATSTPSTTLLQRDYVSFAPNLGDLRGHFFLNGRGRHIDSLSNRPTGDSLTAREMVSATIPRNQATGLATTFLWEFVHDEGTNRIRVRRRLNTDSLVLPALDFDASDPLTLIPASNSWEDVNREINPASGASSYDNNWIATDGGDMICPNRFIARWPWPDVGRNLIIGDIVTKYYSSL